MNTLFSPIHRKTIQEVWDWYEFEVRVLGGAKGRVLDDVRTGVVVADPQFFGMTRGEIDGFFDRHHSELDFMTMLGLMAAAEGALQVDFRERVKNHRQDPVSKLFHTINKQSYSREKRGRIELEQDVLDTWRDFGPGMTALVGEFKGALKVRHWLAHGRYWEAKAGRPYYEPSDVFDICYNLLSVIDGV